jgi:hypothetical protein
VVEEVEIFKNRKLHFNRLPVEMQNPEVAFQPAAG